jgi:thymidine phosphorylase
LEFDPDVRGGDGFNLARDILDSGRALTKMKAIINAQGGSKTVYNPGDLQYKVLAPKSGVVVAIDNLQMAHIARSAGAPLDKGAGVDLHKKTGETVKKHEPLYTVFADFPADFNFARLLIDKNTGYTIT